MGNFNKKEKRMIEMKFTETFLLRMCLLFFSVMSFLISTTMFLIFILPHMTWMPSVSEWQEVAPKIFSQLHEEIDLSDDMNEEDFLLLISIADFFGSMGYDRSTFYAVVSPYWTGFLTITSIYFLVLALVSVAVICYLTYNYQPQYRFIPIPWIIIEFLLVCLLTIGLICLLGDMTSTNRLQLEQTQGTRGNYAMVVTCLIISILYTWLNIMAGYLHVEVKIMEKNKNDKEDALFNLVEVPSIYSNDLPPPPSYFRPQNIYP